MVEPNPSEKYGFVSWDDDIPNMMGKIKVMFQTTNQIGFYMVLMSKNTVELMGFNGFHRILLGFFGGDGISIGFDWDLFGFIWLELMAMQLA